MALAVMGLAADEAIAVQRGEIVAESFPGFSMVLEALGASIQVEEAAESQTPSARNALDGGED
jgi:hypothetical protein